MATTEVALYMDRITRVVERFIAAGEGLSEEEINWKPAEGANSIYVLATHTMGNVRENIVQLLGGEDVGRDRDSEFVATGRGVDGLREAWAALQVRIAAVLDALDAGALDRDYARPRGGETLPGRGILLQTAMHAAEHAGQAELTRDLVRNR